MRLATTCIIPMHISDWKSVDLFSTLRERMLDPRSGKTVLAGSESAGIQESYKKRNYYIVDHADVLVAVYDDDRNVRSDTGQTVRYAIRREKPVILIHPDTVAVSSLPAGGE